MVRRLVGPMACILAVLAVVVGGAQGAGTIYTTHFFDWYKVTADRSYDTAAREWTYSPAWARYGIRTEEIGNTQHYYATQMRMIRKAGFDGIHYEWYGQRPSDEFMAAIRETHMPVALFYDVEIGGQAKYLVVPTEQFAAKLADDVGSFYDRIPRCLWLRQGDGALPVILYCYRFDTSANDPAAWDRFYRSLLSGLKKRVGSSVHIYWTDSGSMQGMYAYQHFPEISSYTFGWWGGQTQVGARAVTLIAGYDDGGSTVQGRTTRTMANDVRFLEENVAMARMCRPPLVFHYGWNEFLEGEHIMPDTTWGDWRLRALASIVSDLKKPTPQPALPRTLILADDLLPAYARKGDLAYESERALLGDYRYLFPRADVALGSTVTPAELRKYQVVVALDRDRTPEQERNLVTLARSGQTRVVVFAPKNPAGSQFTSGPRKPAMEGMHPIPTDQWVSAQRDVDVDVTRFPIVHLRVRNSPGTLYHVRFQGVDQAGKTWSNMNNGQLDFQVSAGKWVERAENARKILEESAGRPIQRITGILFYLDGVSQTANYSADLADVRFTDESGNVGARVDFSKPSDWRYFQNFTNDPKGERCVGSFKLSGANNGAVHLSLHGYNVSGFAVDTTSEVFAPRPEARVLAWGTQERIRVPLVIQRGNLFFVNTLSSSPVVYGALMPALGFHGFRVARHTTFAAVRTDLRITNTTAPTILPREELPIDWVRMIHPPKIPVAVSYPYPATTRPLAMMRTHKGISESVPLVTEVSRRDGSCGNFGEVTVGPDETVDLYRLPVRVQPLRGEVALIRVSDYTRSGAVLTVLGRGEVRLTPTKPGLRLLMNGHPAPARLKGPYTVRLTGPMPFASTP